MRARPWFALAPQVLLLVLTTNPAPAWASTPGIQYLLPLPGSGLLRPGTNIVARFDRALDPAGISPGLVTATGSASGAHVGRVVLSDDGRTIVFRPDFPFAWGEHVQVTIATPTGADATASTSTQFGFSIAAQPPRPFDPLSMLELPAGASAPRAIAPRPSAASDTLPLDFPEIDATSAGALGPGRLFVASFPLRQAQEPSYLLILDDDMHSVFYRRQSQPCFDFKVQPDGRLTYYDSASGSFQAMDSSYNVIDSFACGNGYATDLHELRLLPDGHALLIGDDPEIVDMSAVVPGGNPAATVIGIVVQELDAAKNVVFQWRSWDHFQVTDATHEDLTAASIDYVHSNALELDADGNLVLSSRHMDEITKIDRQTGATLWRWGGKHNEFTFLEDTLGFSHQHAIRRLDDGNFTLFDNGNFHSPPASRALEYQLDEPARTARLVWQFRDTPDIYGNAMGYVQRLANGNTLIGWGTGKPDVIEVAPDGTKVLEMTIAGDLSSYRATRTEWRPEDVADTSVPTLLSLSTGAPNPFRRSTHMTIDLARPARITVRVFDVQGRKVMTVLPPRPQSAGTFAFDLDLSFLPAGVYLCRVDAGSQSETRKIEME